MLPPFWVAEENRDMNGHAEDDCKRARSGGYDLGTAYPSMWPAKWPASSPTIKEEKTAGGGGNGGGGGGGGGGNGNGGVAPALPDLGQNNGHSQSPSNTGSPATIGQSLLHDVESSTDDSTVRTDAHCSIYKKCDPNKNDFNKNDFSSNKYRIFLFTIIIPILFD